MVMVKVMSLPRFQATSLGAQVLAPTIQPIHEVLQVRESPTLRRVIIDGGGYHARLAGSSEDWPRGSVGSCDRIVQPSGDRHWELTHLLE